MLCTKFELIPSSIFQSHCHLESSQFMEKAKTTCCTCTCTCIWPTFFLKIDSKFTPNFLLYLLHMQGFIYWGGGGKVLPQTQYLPPKNFNENLLKVYI